MNDRKNDDNESCQDSNILVENLEATLKEFADRQLGDDENGKANFISFEKSIYNNSLTKCNLLRPLQSEGVVDDELLINLINQPPPSAGMTDDRNTDMPSSEILLPTFWQTHKSSWQSEFAAAAEMKEEEWKKLLGEKTAAIKQEYRSELDQSLIIPDHANRLRNLSTSAVDKLAADSISKRERQQRRWEYIHARIRELISS